MEAAGAGDAATDRPQAGLGQVQDERVEEEQGEEEEASPTLFDVKGVSGPAVAAAAAAAAAAELAAAEAVAAVAAAAPAAAAAALAAVGAPGTAEGVSVALHLLLLQGYRHPCLFPRAAAPNVHHRQHSINTDNLAVIAVLVVVAVTGGGGAAGKGGPVRCLGRTGAVADKRILSWRDRFGMSMLSPSCLCTKVGKTLLSARWSYPVRAKATHVPLATVFSY